MLGGLRVARILGESAFGVDVEPQKDANGRDQEPRGATSCAPQEQGVWETPEEGTGGQGAGLLGRGGGPDLVVWSMERNEIKMVEVKSEGDNLSRGQRVWMEFLVKCGVPVEVLKVRSVIFE